jgi:hypothetical protein
MSRPATKPSPVTAASVLEHVAAGRLQEALAVVRRVPGSDPQHEAAWLELGNKLSERSQFEQAIPLFQDLLRIKPRSAGAHHGLGTIQLQQGDIKHAIATIEAGNAIDPTNAPAYNNLGIAYRYERQLAASRRSFERALELLPDFDTARGNMGMTLLCEGNFDGFALYEYRFKNDVPGDWKRDGGVRVLPGLRSKVVWDGSDLGGKHVVVWAEQGMGDNLMMLRYLPMLRQRGAAKVTALCIPALARTMATVADQVLIDPDDVVDYDFDVYVPSMSMPFYFGTRVDTIPSQVPYLPVPPAAQQAWNGSLARLPGLKVGVVWAGGKTFKRDKLRSLVLRQLAPLMAIEGVHWISLQKGQAAEDLADVDWRILDWVYHCEDLVDTAALVTQLDLVISVDTSVAHLAGALGKPVWLMSRYEGEWRWIVGRTDSPWYPSMRIFQQPAHGDWDSVLADVAQALAPLAAEAGQLGPLPDEQWAACVRDCAAGPQRPAKKGFFARWFA